MIFSDFINSISSGAFDQQFCRLYGSSEKTVLRQRSRFMSAAENFSRLYPESGEIRVFSAPGRTEIGGNHTDHQHGCVLAAAVSADAIAIVSANSENVIRVSSDGYDPISIPLDSLSPVDTEKGTSAGLIRGIASAFSAMGTPLSGFNAFVSSDVISGSGLSSSAAFEVLTGTIIDSLFNEGKAGPVKIAEIGQFAENKYFGKSCGIMDQLVSSVGGPVFLDLADPSEPVIESVGFDLRSAGYSICITDTKGSHAGLSDEYSAVSREMCNVASKLGCEVLRSADEADFYEKLPELRKVCTDRELIRAAHFFDENKRASLEAEALQCGDTEGFFELVNSSGASSAMLLQNLFPPASPETQPINLALMLTRRFLAGSGASRVHGGGFAGTIQAFVPSYMVPGYIKEMERVFGSGCCFVLNIRADGGYEFKL